MPLNRYLASMKKSEHAASGDQQLYSGLIRLHVLHHAAEKPVYGLWLIEELSGHGYKLSAGTLYPLLHGMEKRGYLRSVEERSGQWTRRVYRATPKGREALNEARGKVRELFGELIEGRQTSKKVKAGGYRW
jgi:PadR family transcriptional regulator, regulatory protein PadR